MRSVTPGSLLKDLRQIGVELWADGDRLRYRAPHGVLTEMLRRTIAEHKSEVLALLSNRNAFVERPDLPVIRADRGGRGEEFELNEIQQAYWLGRGRFFEMGNVAAHVYGEVEASTVDLGRLSGAWQRLIERHEMLRAVVLPEGRQRILQEVPRYEIELEDVAGAEENQKLERIRNRMSHQVRPADQWPLFERCDIGDDVGVAFVQAAEGRPAVEVEGGEGFVAGPGAALRGH